MDFSIILALPSQKKKAAEIDTSTIPYHTIPRWWLGKVHKEVCKLHVYRATVGKPAKKAGKINTTTDRCIPYMYLR